MRKIRLWNPRPRIRDPKLRIQRILFAADRQPPSVRRIFQSVLNHILYRFQSPGIVTCEFLSLCSADQTFLAVNLHGKFKRREGLRDESLHLNPFLLKGNRSGLKLGHLKKRRHQPFHLCKQSLCFPQETSSRLNIQFRALKPFQQDIQRRKRRPHLMRDIRKGVRKRRLILLKKRRLLL